MGFANNASPARAGYTWLYPSYVSASWIRSARLAKMIHDQRRYFRSVR
jgi:hypothetical protein